MEKLRKFFSGGVRGGFVGFLSYVRRDLAGFVERSVGGV